MNNTSLVARILGLLLLGPALVQADLTHVRTFHFENTAGQNAEVAFIQYQQAGIDSVRFPTYHFASIEIDHHSYYCTRDDYLPGLLTHFHREKIKDADKAAGFIVSDYRVGRSYLLVCHDMVTNESKYFAIILYTRFWVDRQTQYWRHYLVETYKPTPRGLSMVDSVDRVYRKKGA